MSAKTIIDGILGMATTCAFAKEEGGAVIAAGIGVVGFLFDAIFGIAGGETDIPPMQRNARRQDIKDAVKELEVHIDASIWRNGTLNYIDKINATKTNIDIALDQAGQKGPDGLFPGPTPVWHNGVIDGWFNEVSANPSDIEVLMQRLMSHPAPSAFEVVLFCHAASVYFLMCKVGQVWEINNGFAKFQPKNIAYTAEKNKVGHLQKAWDKYEKAHPGAKHGKRPVLTATAPTPPAPGDVALGSWDQKNSGKPMSYLGYKHSYFANQVRAYLKIWKAWVEPQILAYDKVWNDAHTAVHDRCGRITVVGTNPLHRWQDTDAAGKVVAKGQQFWSAEMASFQAEMKRGSIIQPDFTQHVHDGGVSPSSPHGYKLGVLSRADIDKLLETMAKWDEMDLLYNGRATANGKKPPADGWLI